jgi:hypothetical protein
VDSRLSLRGIFVFPSEFVQQIRFPLFYKAYWGLNKQVGISKALSALPKLPCSPKSDEEQENVRIPPEDSASKSFCAQAQAFAKSFHGFETQSG